jgi:hypothetical protein
MNVIDAKKLERMRAENRTHTFPHPTLASVLRSPLSKVVRMPSGSAHSICSVAEEKALEDGCSHQ